jgi:hypothetical protein
MLKKLGSSKRGFILCIIYIVLFITAFTYAKLTIVESPLSSIYIFILTIPWSYIDTTVLFALGIVDSVPTNIKLMLHVIYAFINVLIIYYLGYRYDNRKK